VIIAIDSIHGR